VISKKTFYFSLLIAGVVATLTAIVNYNVVENTLSKTLKMGVHTISTKDTYVQPDVFFHGSPDRTLEILEPREISPRNKSEGEVVFATPHMAHASIFMLDKRASGVKDVAIRVGSFNRGPTFCLCNNREKFLACDKGGAIYVLPAHNFYYDLGYKGITRNEWIKMSYDQRLESMGSLCEWANKKSVKPLYKLEFDSTLQAMLSLGVQVFFVDNNQFKEITAAFKDSENPEKRRRLFMTLESENKKRGINDRPLFDYSKYR